MKPETIDLLILGAGPAGLSAAIEARSHGLSVMVLDEQQGPGGQIYRGILESDSRRLAVLGADYQAGHGLAATFMGCGAHYIPGASVWQVEQDMRVHYLHEGRSHTVQASRLVVATGAYERPMPIPGWTLPGVMTAGAGQILLKGAALLPSKPVVLAGGGPLLYLLAVQYLRAGIQLAALVDTSSSADILHAWRHIPRALMGWRDLLKGVSLLAILRRARVSHFRGARELGIEGDQCAEALSFTCGETRHSLPANLILLHQGIVPNTQISWSLGLAHEWSEEQLCWRALRDSWGETTLPGVFLAGDGGSIGGALAAREQGHLAALAIAAQLQHLSASNRDRLARPHFRALARCLAARPLLDAMYRPHQENRIPQDDVIVCRCEEVTAGQVRAHVRLGCLGPNQTKAFGRCGMGPCQGRLCGLTVTEIIADQRQVPRADVGYYRIRPPLKPITLAQLAGQPSHNLDPEAP
ncbi:NAD(P)/FAD-dependent oxidoreductase [Pseudomonas sp. AU11447]|uniref:NAD(P)/FAD-dependent oxidoreductase n=1 Tax=Pseudomonas sp. AU11447 TaxID=1843184 RepID=UPI0009F50524|nr:NAD(P)/FAD-dependent oxidoreductase [Pseudomonas sp. AU11447]